MRNEIIKRLRGNQLEIQCLRDNGDNLDMSVGWQKYKESKWSQSSRENYKRQAKKIEDTRDKRRHREEEYRIGQYI